MEVKEKWASVSAFCPAPHFTNTRTLVGLDTEDKNQVYGAYLTSEPATLSTQGSVSLFLLLQTIPTEEMSRNSHWSTCPWAERCFTLENS